MSDIDNNEYPGGAMPLKILGIMTEKTKQMREDHHPWCNYFMLQREECKQCERLFAEYPILEEDKPGDLMARHFPKNVPAWERRRP